MNLGEMVGERGEIIGERGEIMERRRKGNCVLRDPPHDNSREWYTQLCTQCCAREPMMS